MRLTDLFAAISWPVYGDRHLLPAEHRRRRAGRPGSRCDRGGRRRHRRRGGRHGHAHRHAVAGGEDATSAHSAGQPPVPVVRFHLRAQARLDLRLPRLDRSRDRRATVQIDTLAARGRGAARPAGRPPGPDSSAARTRASSSRRRGRHADHPGLRVPDGRRRHVPPRAPPADLGGAVHDLRRARQGGARDHADRLSGAGPRPARLAAARPGPEPRGSSSGGSLGFGGIELDFDQPRHRAARPARAIRAHQRARRWSSRTSCCRACCSRRCRSTARSACEGRSTPARRSKDFLSFDDAPISGVRWASDAYLFISQFFFTTPAQELDWWTGLTLEGGVAFNDGVADKGDFELDGRPDRRRRAAGRLSQHHRRRGRTSRCSTWTSGRSRSTSSGSGRASRLQEVCGRRPGSEGGDPGPGRPS